MRRTPASRGLPVAVAVAAALTAAACSAPHDGLAGEESTPAGAGDAEAGSGTDPDAGPVAAPTRHPLAGSSIYFVIPDRFANGDPGNDHGGLDSTDPLVTGFLPSDIGYHHGGDLAGLIADLPYIAGLGVDAIWITPPFTNRFAQGDGTIEGSSSSYHGYWQVNWEQVDPHLGTEAEMQRFIDAAHELDLRVIFDIVVNHTGDVIRYPDDSTAYWPIAAKPYLDAEGRPFDAALPAGSGDFPPLDPAVSFPYRPGFASAADATAKRPDWLNDPTNYHNRGNSSFSGESDTYGDFYGLDDLFTENPAVVEGMIELYRDIIDRYDVDGFRIDTVKHVNIEFWRVFAPAIRAAAADTGKPDFLLFGEVFTTDPIGQSSYTGAGLTSTLDFIVADALDRYVAGRGNGEDLAAAFDQDDWFTDSDGNASAQVTFFGNHDIGRMGHLIDRANPSADDEALLKRMRLGFDLLFLTRGIPVVYYGDEQGFIGRGGDQAARQDLFPSLAPEYLDDDTIGSDATPADDNLDPDHPLYRHVADLSALVDEHPTLATGAQLVHPVAGPLFAFSRFDRAERREYVVITNSNGALSVPAKIKVLSAGTELRPITPVSAGDGPFTVDDNGTLAIGIGPLETVVLRADTTVPVPKEPPTLSLVRPETGAEIPTARYRIEATASDGRYGEVTFAVAVDGAEAQILGVDDAPPYRLYWDNSALPADNRVELIATFDDGSGRLRADRAAVTLGDRPTTGS